MKKRISNMTGKMGTFLNKHMDKIACACLMCVMISGIAFASGDTVTADTLWASVIGLVKTWVTRLGAVVMIIGGVMFGLGWQREDASAKSNGVTTMISGAIVIAVVNLISKFAA